MSLGKHHTALDKLIADAQKQYADHLSAKHDLERNTWRAAREVTTNLFDYKAAIDYHKPDATPEADREKRSQELTAEFCAALQERGLIVSATGNGGAVTILDPAIDRRFFESNQLSVKAQAAVKAYEKDNADSLQAEVNAADAKLIKDALASGDGGRIREVLKV